MSYVPKHLLDLPLYKKAMDIWILSRSISTYLNDDLSCLKSNGKEDYNIYFSGDIVRQSRALVPEIINAEINKVHTDKKFKHIKSLHLLTKRIYKNCKRLETCNSNGKDYLPLLRKELRKFNRLQKQWLLTL